MRSLVLRAAVPLALLLVAPAAHAIEQPATFSIVAYDSVTQELGVAVESKYFAVGRVVPWAEAGVAAVATQANVNPTYGPKALAMAKSGMSPDEIMRGFVVRPSERHPEYRERWVDLHVEDHATPIAELHRLWNIHQGFHGAGGHMEMAAEYEAAGRKDLAELERERVYETLVGVLARNEKDASLLNGLAWSCAEHDLHLPDALKAAERAAALEPKSTDILDTFAEVHFRMGHAAQALAIEKRAAAIDPKNPYLQAQVARFGAGTSAAR